ncbi:MAG TPA: hypothetical protein VEC76_11945 [Streptosporangiaceae bacterium]|nr:hypothetical protein [Streptosporangiaceae bacterium]
MTARLPGQDVRTPRQDVRAPGQDVRVLYLAGIPRTGSTVLGQALGGQPDAIFVGELNFFWRRFAHRELCSCRRPLPECPFWSAVVSRAYGDLSPGRATALAELERWVLRRQSVLALVPARGPVRRRAGVATMLAERAQLYRSVAEVAGASWIVDAGKEPVFGSFLARADHVSFGTVHLVRDPRGVAFSWKKRVRSDSEPGEMPRHPAARTAVDWLLQNLMVQLSLQRLSRVYVRVRYEDLVARPADIVAGISRATGLAATGLDAHHLGAAGLGEHHLVAGNPGVRQLAGSGLELTLDEEWRAHLSRADRLVVTAVCATLMTAYGYRVLAGR